MIITLAHHSDMLLKRCYSDIYLLFGILRDVFLVYVHCFDIFFERF